MNKKGGRAWVRGVCAPAVVTGMFSKAVPFRPMLRLVTEFLCLKKR